MFSAWGPQGHTLGITLLRPKATKVYKAYEVYRSRVRHGTTKSNCVALCCRYCTILNPYNPDRNAISRTEEDESRTVKMKEGLVESMRRIADALCICICACDLFVHLLQCFAKGLQHSNSPDSEKRASGLPLASLGFRGIPIKLAFKAKGTNPYKSNHIQPPIHQSSFHALQISAACSNEMQKKHI